MQMPIGVIADNADRGAADTGFFVLQLIHDLYSVIVPFRPAHVHAQEHLRPVARLGAAGARLHAQIGVAGILRPAQHGLHLELGQLLLK